MWSIAKKEFRQFFSSLTGLVAIVVFLLLNGLFLFVFPDTSILDYGYATLDKFFELAPWILLFLVPAVTMRTWSDEFKSGTFELLRTRPLTAGQMVTGKYLGALAIVFIALLPTVIYVFSVQSLSAGNGIDAGGTIGSFIGLFLLAAVFTAIGTWCSSITPNSVVAFILSAFVCFLLYTGFNAVSKIPALQGGVDYVLENLGIDSHYRSISRGVIDSRDIIYFASLVLFFLLITNRKIALR
ncbi:gliding motility-associated ABC transporter permease subunit GldF [Flavihumibacter rivuli]|uniref:gliding motility-associated ABC transporter permease subunit GldF n=1 Tax=Flavihumibacter rivuli TaxID=2838156 RepID=UPI001BDEF188|nr:gliding motility-associated ABC transporter permease subunit GldF [Flavihumibacter rivuli]ULQ54973.1 gliding motility-associated ABC transporter permease subunit GldF [Flavihumibacter rivuli]